MPPQDDFHTPNHPAVPSSAVFVEWTQVVLSLTTQRHRLAYWKDGIHLVPGSTNSEERCHKAVLYVALDQLTFKDFSFFFCEINRRFEGNLKGVNCDKTQRPPPHMKSSM